VDDDGVQIVSRSPQKPDATARVLHAADTAREPIVHQIGAVSSNYVLPVADPHYWKNQLVGEGKDLQTPAKDHERCLF
jgi:hypothetical protein